MKNRKVYRGVGIKKCQEYDSLGIPLGQKFTTKLSEAKKWGKCIFVFEKNKDFKSIKKDNKTFSELGLQDRYYKNIKHLTKLKLVGKKW